MGIIIYRNGNTEELIGLGDIEILGSYPAFKYYHTGVSSMSVIYSWVNEIFEIDGKTYNSKTNFYELYSILKTKIDLFNLE